MIRPSLRHAISTALLAITLVRGTFVFAQVESTMNSLTLGPVRFGENRMPIDLDRVNIKVDATNLDVKAAFVPDSLAWVRMGEVLPVPRARLFVKVAADARDVTLRYLDSTLVTQVDGDHAFTELFVILFFPNTVDVFIKGQKRATIAFNMPRGNEERTQLLDYSCAPFDLAIKGLDGEHLSVGCYLARHGGMGAERGQLEIRWTAAGWHLPGDKSPPYVATMLPGHAARFAVVDNAGNERTVEMTARVPERLPRLKTALGFGPYAMRSRERTNVSAILPSPAVMLYGRFDLSDATSLRFFDAYFPQKTVFNNFGLYYAYDVGSAFDRRVEMSLQLGFQGIQFRHYPNGTLDNRAIFPQGFEITYRHAFGWPNYSFVYGMFLPTTIAEDYKNVWVRFGRRVFWELNYLSWQREERSVYAWGLSAGVPFVSFL